MDDASKKYLCRHVKTTGKPPARSKHVTIRCCHGHDHMFQSAGSQRMDQLGGQDSPHQPADAVSSPKSGGEYVDGEFCEGEPGWGEPLDAKGFWEFEPPPPPPPLLPD